MADIPVLEDLLLGGYDVSALLTGAPSQTPGGALLGLEAQLQLKASALSQQTLAWPTPASTDQNDIYQKVAQSLAAKLEEHRLQQVQVATALQQLQALQQQQELAQLQQQLNALHQHVPRAATNPFQRSRTTDLESLGRGTAFDVAASYAPAIDFEQQKQFVALQQAANSNSPLVGLQRLPGVISQHNLPVRSFSSEHLAAGQRRPAPHFVSGATSQLPAQGMPNKRPPMRQPSGLGPNGRGGGNGQGRGDGGRRARYAATAKAPSWASEDWHPMKAVLASGAHASGGTGVFLPHLAAGSSNLTSVPTSGAAAVNSHSTTNNGSKPAANGASQGSYSRAPERSVIVDATVAPSGVTLQAHPSGLQPFINAGAAVTMSGSGSGGSSASHSPMSPMHDGSPSCSVESNAVCSVVDPYSRQTTMELSRGSTHSELDSHPATNFGYLVDTMKVVVEEPEREREDANEECDFVSLARELAELMSKQVITE